MKHLVLALIFGVFIGANARLVHKSNKIGPAVPKDNRPVVPGSKQCGGTGKLIWFKDDGCEHFNGHCRYKTEKSPEIDQLDWVASKDTPELWIKVYCHPSGQVHLDHKIPNSAIKAGVEYTLNNEYILEPDLKYAKGISRMELYNPVDKAVEICLEWELEII